MDGTASLTVIVGIWHNLYKELLEYISQCDRHKACLEICSERSSSLQLH